MTKLMSGDLDIRSRKQVINIVISAITKTGAVACSFFFVPMCINYLDIRSYGVWVTMTSIVSWISFLDGGVGNGLKNKLSETIANDDKETGKRLITSSYAGIFFIVSATIIFYLLVEKFFSYAQIFNVPVAMANEIRATFMVVFIFFCIRMLFDLINTILLAFQKVWLVNVIGLIINLLLLFGVYSITRSISHDKLYYLSLCFSIIPVLVLAVCSIVLFCGKYRYLTPRLKYYDYRTLRNILSLGVRFFIIQIAVIIIFSTDNLIITQLFNPADVSIYNIAFKYFSVFTFGWSIIIAPYWVAFNEAYIKGDFNWIKKTINFLLKLWVLLVVGVFIFLFLSNRIYTIWVGPDIKIPFKLSALMALFVLISTLSNIFVYFINGIGKLKIQFYASVFAGIINLPLSYFFAVTMKMGISGVITSTCISLISGPILGSIQYKKIINKTAEGIWLK